MRRLFFTFFLVLIFLHGLKANSDDSIRNIFLGAKVKDTALANQIYAQAKSLRYSGNYSLAKQILQENKKWIFKLSSSKHIGMWLNAYGLVWDFEGYADTALNYYNSALPRFIKAKDKYGQGGTYLNIAITYMYKGDNKKAIDYFLSGLEIAEKSGFKKLANTINLNIGGIYFNLGNFKKAKYYFEKRLLAGDEPSAGTIGSAYYNLGMIYFKWNKFDSSAFFLKQAILKFGSENDLLGVADANAALGAVYRQTKNYSESKLHYEKAFAIMHKFDQPVSPDMYMNAAILYAFINQKRIAYGYCDTALSIVKKLNSRAKLAAFLHVRSQVYNVFGEYKKAFDDLNLYSQINDSIFTDENIKSIQDMKIEYDKKKESDSIKLNEKVKRERQKAVLEAEAAAQDKRNKTIIYGVIAIAIIIIVFAIFLYRRFQVTKKQNRIIELQKKEVTHQKELVEEKNKEIVDSINYAKRLQEAILPSENSWNEHFRNTFILYMPKDIVAGDFYWLDVIQKNIMFAAADCTGHGVPGALVSVVCSNALNRSVNEFGLTEPGKILDKTTELVIETFIKSGSEVKDGMDISLCNYVPDENKLFWSGANNPLWILRNNEILEWKADKQPVGMYFDRKNFTTHEIDLQKGDTIYIFSDGYSDQFGGEKKKKFKESSLKKLLISVTEESMKVQKEKIKNEFLRWKGSLEQIDDVCIIGIRI